MALLLAGSLAFRYLLSAMFGSLINLSRRAEICAGGVFLVSAATLVAAWGFQYIGGYLPCELCYQERVPYYIGIPLALVALVSALYGGPAWLTRGALLLTGLMFAWGTYLAGYHTGVEWHFWQGPTDCTGSGGAALSAGDLLKQIQNIKVVPCDRIQWSLFGLSFAGWNTVVSFCLAVASLYGVLFARVQQPAKPAAAI